jgi:hypothetical protein
VASRTQAVAHRRDLKELVRLAQRDLQVLFDRYTDPESARDALLAVMPALIAAYGSAAATLAADWYDDLRDAEGLRGPRFTAIPAELPGEERADILVRWGVGALFAADPDFRSAFSNTAGGLTRIIADADRYTITQSSTEDRRSPGWERVVSGGSCDFCQDLAGEHTGPDFGSHDHCLCVAAPRFD